MEHNNGKTIKNGIAKDINSVGCVVSVFKAFVKTDEKCALCTHIGRWSIKSAQENFPPGQAKYVVA